MTNLKPYKKAESFCDDDVIFCSHLALIKTIRCLQKALAYFKISAADPLEEDFWWSQCERCWAEIEIYKERVSDEVIELITAHVRASNGRKSSKEAHDFENP